MSEFHREKAREAITLMGRSGVDALLLFPGADIGYFTGFTIGSSERIAAALIPFDGEPALIVNELERDLRGQKPWIEHVEVWREHEDPVRLLADIICRGGLAHGVIGIAEDAYWGWVNRLQGLVPDARFVNISRHLNAVRMVKAPQELDWMRKACAIADRALQHGFNKLHNGMTERELASAITGEMRHLGGGDTFCTALFGERAALPHGRAADRRLKPGDAVLVDTGTTFHGYWSDITRTVFYGEPTPRQRELYELVYKANRAGFEAARAGATCESVDAAGRKVIADAGLGDHFIHRLGHGVGLQIHERPYIVRGNGLELRPGMTFTIEPGVYIVGEIGIRVEDTVVCSGDGCESLTGHRRTLTSYPVRG